LDVDPRQRSLYQYLLDRGGIEAIANFDSTQLHIRPQEVLSKLQSGDPAWETMVPPEVAKLIRERNLFRDAKGAGEPQPGGSPEATA
jgi:hypothetical protein